MLTLQIDENDVFQVTRESVEGGIPECLQSDGYVSFSANGDYCRLNAFGQDNRVPWSHYLVRFPDPIGIQVLTPEQLEAMRAECPYEKAARQADQLYDKWSCAGGFHGHATGAKIIAQAIRNLANGGKDDG